MGDGESCNQGVHEVDVARWLLGETTLPRRVMSVGGRFVFNDAGEVPNTQIIYYDYPTAPILYEVHNMRAGKDTKAMPSFRGRGVDTCVQCEGGYVMMHAGVVCDNQGKEIKRFSGREDHFGNFVRALRSGKREDLNADVLEGHLSTNICHAGNISYRLGQRASAAQVRDQIGNLPAFQEMFERYLEHLQAHDVPAGESILGPWLECDPAHECIKDHPQANELVKGFYRKPFEVPEITV
jgi:predicted dehydrogenase